MLKNLTYYAQNYAPKSQCAQKLTVLLGLDKVTAPLEYLNLTLVNNQLRNNKVITFQGVLIWNNMH